MRRLVFAALRARPRLVVTLALSAAAALGAVLGAQTTTAVQPDAVDVLILPASGDPMTVAPIAVTTWAIAFDSNCGYMPTPPLSSPVVNPTGIEFADPFTVDRACHLPLPELPNGLGYRAVTVFIKAAYTVDGVTQANCRSARSALAIPLTFDIQKCGAFAVKVAVGDWTRTVKTGDKGWVSYSLLSSLNPVTLVIVKLNGQEQDRQPSSDLRKNLGSYFDAPDTPGTYALTVEARDANGCSDGSSRPMTVKVERR